MKKILIIGIATLFFSGCIINSDNKNAISDDELFVKKKECAEMQTKIETRIKEDWNDETRGAWLNKIFYSPKRNSCLYTMQISATIKDIVIYNLFDAFTNEKIESETGCTAEEECGKNLNQAKLDFDNKIAKYE